MSTDAPQRPSGFERAPSVLTCGFLGGYWDRTSEVFGVNEPRNLPLACVVAFAFAESAKSPPELASVRSLRIVEADYVGVVVQLEGGELVPILGLRDIQLCDVLTHYYTSTLGVRPAPNNGLTPQHAGRVLRHDGTLAAGPRLGESDSSVSSRRRVAWSPGSCGDLGCP
jgi:hypothetical protein